MSKITATGSRRILQERSGKVTGSCRKAPEIAGSGSSIPTGNFLDFFRWIPVNFMCFPAGTGRKSSEKIRKFFGGNTASMFQRFPVLSCRNQPVIFDLSYIAFIEIAIQQEKKINNNRIIGSILSFKLFVNCLYHF